MGRSFQAPNARNDLPQRIQFTTSVGTYKIAIIYNQMNPDIQYPISKIQLYILYHKFTVSKDCQWLASDKDQSGGTYLSNNEGSPKSDRSSHNLAKMDIICIKSSQLLPSYINT